MNKALTFIDKIYCINLDARKDRWEKVTGEFSRIGILDSVTRISGIVDHDPRKGCLESHLFCIKESINCGYKNILIFEDDVCFLSNEQIDFLAVVNYLEEDNKWDLFYFGGNVMYPARFVHKHIFKSRFFSTHAYVINQRAYTKFLNATIPIDEWYALNTVSYGLYPLYATQNESYSDIRKKVIEDREAVFTGSYESLVKPNFFMRWINYIKTHYISRYL